MLFLLFRIGGDLYALEAGRIGEVLPMVQTKALAGAPRGVVGVMNHRGVPVPVLDPGAILLGRPARHQLSTRIVLVRAGAAASASSGWLGLILEQATETLRCNPADFVPVGAAGGAVPFLGRVLAHPRGLIRWVEPDRLLPETLSSALSSQPAASP
jgi:chemotaxis-related protein WspB